MGTEHFERAIRMASWGAFPFHTEADASAGGPPRGVKDPCAGWWGRGGVVSVARTRPPRREWSAPSPFLRAGVGGRGLRALALREGRPLTSRSGVVAWCVGSVWRGGGSCVCSLPSPPRGGSGAVCGRALTHGRIHPQLLDIHRSVHAHSSVLKYCYKVLYVAER